MSAEYLASELQKLVDAAVIVDSRADADKLIADLQARGWTLDNQTVIAGKRIRVLVPPSEGN